MQKGSEMEIFNELVKREPRLLDRPIEELLPIRYIGEAAVAGYRALVLKLDDLPMTQEQRAKTLADGQDAGKMLLAIEGRIGKLIPKAPRGDRHSSDFKKKSEEIKKIGATGDQRYVAHAIADHPEAVEEVIKEAEESEDIPTKAAVLNKITQKRQKEYAETHKQEIEKTKLEMTLEQTQFLNILEWIIEKLPRTPPKDWTEKGVQMAKGLVKIIIKRLEVFTDGENESGEGRRISESTKT